MQGTPSGNIPPTILPLDAGVWDWQRYLGLAMLLGTIIGTVCLADWPPCKTSYISGIMYGAIWPQKKGWMNCYRWDGKWKVCTQKCMISHDVLVTNELMLMGEYQRTTTKSGCGDYCDARTIIRTCTRKHNNANATPKDGCRFYCQSRQQCSNQFWFCV